MKTHNYLLLHHHHRYPWNPHLILAQKCDNYEGHVCWISNYCRIDLCPNLVIENSGPKICTTCLSPEKIHILSGFFHILFKEFITLSSKRKYTEATNNPWNEYRKCDINDHTAKLCHEPRKGFGHRKCNIFVMPNSGSKKNKDFKDFL